VQRTKFSEWLMKRHWSSRLFADRLAAELGQATFSTNTIDNWRAGKTRPRDRAMIAIKKVSNDELTADDFLIERNPR